MTNMPTSAMIFAAGFGTRMGALTKSCPKPMVPLAGQPMINYTIAWLRDAGISRIVANTHYLAERIEPHLKDQGVLISAEQNAILETGGGLREALPLLGDGPVITINPDALWTGTNPVAQLLDAWESDMSALLLVHPLAELTQARDRGDFDLNGGSLTRGGDFVYTGAQIIDPSSLSAIPDHSFSLNRYWNLLAQTRPLSGIVHSGGWHDIGTPEGLKHAEEVISNA